MKTIILLLCGIAAVFLVEADLSSAAGFDCSKAASQQEKLICGNQELSYLDDQLDITYRRALKNIADKETLKKEQLNWIKSKRNACRDAASMQAVYNARIAALINSIQAAIQKAIHAANESFTFQGEPINPRMVGDLLPSEADMYAGPAAVDLEGGSNKYYADKITMSRERVVRAIWKEGNKDETGMMFQYKRLGTLSNGMHVIQTWENGGGSGTFVNLILVKFLIDTEYTDGGRVRNRLLMMRTGMFSLGSGYAGTIQVQSNQISIGPGGVGLRENAKTEVINFK